MRAYINISINAFMELVRQPFYLVLTTLTMAFITFLGSVYYFAFGQDESLATNSALAMCMLSGLFASVFCASSSVAHEIQAGTALTVLSKPISRIQFILGKYTGLAAAISLLSLFNLIATLVCSRIAFESHGEPDTRVLAVFFGAMAVAYLFGVFANYFLNQNFSGTTVFALLATSIIALLVVCGISHGSHDEGFGAGVDWRLVPAVLLLTFALLILAALALACTTRLDMVPTLTICGGCFLIGLMSDYLFGRPAEDGSLLATVIYAALPNWQVFWMADALENGKSIPLKYILQSVEYLIGFLVICLSGALYLFEERELG